MADIGEQIDQLNSARLLTEFQRDIDQENAAKNQAATDTLAKNSRGKELPLLANYQATKVVENPDGTVTVTTASGKERRIPAEDLDYYESQKKNNLLLAEEENNKLDAFRRWGIENQRVDLDTAINASDSDLLRNPAFSDFSAAHAESIRAGTGPLYDTPYSNEQADRSALAATQSDQAARISQAAVAAEQTVETRVPAVPEDLDDNELQRIQNRDQAAKVQRAREQAEEFNDSTNKSVLEAIQKTAGSAVAAQADESTKTEDSTGSAGAEEGMSQEFVYVASRDDKDEKVAKDSIRPNPLDQYTSYTYGLSLHILDKEEYNNMVENMGQGFNPKHTLIASAGRDGSGTGTRRAPGWEDNFFFDNLKFSSIIGLNSDSRGTNSINIDFTIIEPMGLSLVDRLIRTTKALYAAGQSSSKSNTTEITYFHNCYCLQIDFFDSEKGCIIDQRKYLPIQLTGLSIKVTARGSEYSITSQPFGHHALLQSIASTPANFEITAKTLRDFFQSDDATSRIQGQNAANQRETQNKVLASVGAARAADNPEQPAATVKSYVSAYNGWYKELKRLNVTDKTKAPTKISVVFDEEILKNNGDIIYRTPATGTSVGDSPMVDDKTSRAGNDKTASEKDKDKFIIAAGTQVTEVINMAMQNSEYIRRQIIIPEKTSKTNTQESTGDDKLRWWKIIPAVKLQDFDPVTNIWSFDITYYVISYLAYNTTHPYVPKAKPVKANCVKEFQYLYTGNNLAVMDFQVEFDYMYFVKVLAQRDKNIDDPTKAETFKAEEKAGGDTNDRKASNNINSAVLKHVTDEKDSAGKRTRTDEISMAVANVNDNIYSSAQGEMLNVTMKIIGDPEFIKQDDVFTGIARSLTGQPSETNGQSFPTQDKTIDSSGLAKIKENNNSLIMDSGDVLCWVYLRMPVDIDTQTGGTRKATQAGDLSGFTGVYKVLMVDSDFNRGQFTQTLTLIRYADQPQDEEFKQYNTQRLSATESAGRGNAPVDVIVDNSSGTDSSRVVISASTDSENSDEFNAAALDARLNFEFTPESDRQFQIDTNQQQLIDNFRVT